MPDSRLVIELKEIVGVKFVGSEMGEKFLERLEEGNLTIDENPQSHFCAYFAAYDPVLKELFIGHHKKAGLWLVNGGHVDEGEVLQEALKREIDEEWGLKYEELKVGKPQLLTITEIYNPEKQPCCAHYDVWHFVLVDKGDFRPDKDKLAEEFFENKWVGLDEARKLFQKGTNHNKAVDFIEENLIV